MYKLDVFEQSGEGKTDIGTAVNFSSRKIIAGLRFKSYTKKTFFKPSEN